MKTKPGDHVERVYTKQALLEFIGELRSHYDAAVASGADVVRLVIEQEPDGHVCLGKDEPEPS